VERVKTRLDRVWKPARGPVLAVGEPNGLIEIEPTGVREVALVPPPPGQPRSLWGTDPGHLFICGGYHAPFVLHRRGLHWSQLPLPPETALLYDVRGLGEREVYVAGEKGQLLLWDGQAMSRLPVPTTRILTALGRLSGTLMCAAGYQGTLLAGNRQGWRLVPTHTDQALLALAELDGKVYYGADGVVWSFDGRSAPQVAIPTPARWVSGLADGLVLDDGQQSKLYRRGKLDILDTTV
jgi:hypothetical protein